VALTLFVGSTEKFSSASLYQSITNRLVYKPINLCLSGTFNDENQKVSIYKSKHLRSMLAHVSKLVLPSIICLAKTQKKQHVKF